MLPRRFISVATASRHTVSVAQHLHFPGIVMPVSQFTHLPRMFSSSRPDGEGRPEEHDAGDQQQEHKEQTKDDRAIRKQGTSQQRKAPNRRNQTTVADTPSRLQSSKKKWRAPFWLPPPSSSSSSSSSSPRNDSRNRNNRKTSRFEERKIPANRFRDASLPCRHHLDPDKSIGLPTSDWVQLFGALPMTSLEEVVDTIENALRKEALDRGGIIDLDTEWNPHRDGESPPLVPSILEYPPTDPAAEERREYALDKDIVGISNSSTIDDNDPDSNDATDETTIQMESFRVVKAHVVLSPFGRPTGWNVKLANPSLVHALLTAAKNARVKGSLRIGWKFAKVKEYHPPSSSNSSRNNSKSHKKHPSHDPKDTRTMLVVSDSMVRFENCPPTLTEDYLRHMLSRYELTPKGPTILRWRGQTSDGRIPPLTFVARFASPAYARAAVREMQGKFLDERPIKLIQYPRQLL